MRRAALCLWLCSCAPALTPEQQAEVGRNLVIAAHRGDVVEVQRLLDLGVSVDSRCGPVPTKTFQDEQGGWPMAAAQWTALIAAASTHRKPPVPDGHLEVVRLLIRRKADLNLHDGYGATALYSAVYRSRWQKESLPMALELLAAGADVNTRTGVYIDGSGDVTPLHRAMGDPLLTKALLERGANPNARDTGGDTPLHWATLDKNIDCVNLLIEAGADVNLRDRKGRTALFWVSSVARAKQDPELDADAKARILKQLESHVEPPSELEKVLRAAGAKD
jgi:ankyrin repeat protein